MMEYAKRPNPMAAQSAGRAAPAVDADRQNPALTENSTLDPAMLDPSLVDEKLGSR